VVVKKEKKFSFEEKQSHISKFMLFYDKDMTLMVATAANIIFHQP